MLDTAQRALYAHLISIFQPPEKPESSPSYAEAQTHSEGSARTPIANNGGAIFRLQVA